MLTDSASIRTRFENKPIQLLRIVDPTIRFPKKIRQVFAHVWKQVDKDGKPCTRFIIKGPRGGGKSKMLGALGFAKWYLQGLNIVDMGGSLEQAKNVYNYFAGHCYSHSSIIDALPSEPLMQMTKSDQGNYFKAIAASLKQIRGPHPDVLFGDEVCETKDELVLAALPMVDTSERQLVVLTSTFHKIFGIFQDIWDKADQYGYTRLSWDVFDVCKEFDRSIWDDPTLRREIHDLDLLKERAAGRTGDSEGWIPFANILQAWREKESLDYFDVEYMGMRPSAAGMVLDPEDVDACTFQDEDVPEYEPGAECILGLDWGFSSMTSVVELMSYKDRKKVELWNKNYTRVRSKVIIEDVVARVILHKIRTVYADSAGKFENQELRAALIEKLPKQHKCTVVEVEFSKHKEEMLGNLRAHFQQQILIIPISHREALWQFKRYRYAEGSDKPVKKDDHIPDATMCALRHYPLRISRGIDKANIHQRQHGDPEGIASSLYKEDF